MNQVFEAMIILSYSDIGTSILNFNVLTSPSMTFLPPETDSYVISGMNTNPPFLTWLMLFKKI